LIVGQEFKLPKAGSVVIAPSILSADFANLESEVQQIKGIGIEVVHLDVMDGHFVPNITLGPPIVKNLRKHFPDMVMDAHLMITDPDKYIEPFADAGADHITFHIEANGEPDDIISRLHDMGVSAGLCVNPATEVKTIEKYASRCQMILVMTVNPGFGGQSFMADAAKKIVDIRKMVGDDIRIEVDGGIDATTAVTVVGYGADTLVAGNAIFGKADRRKAIEDIEKNYK
jgi:ribulose-phosphate 3-epimerase